MMFRLRYLILPVSYHSIGGSDNVLSNWTRPMIRDMSAQEAKILAEEELYAQTEKALSIEELELIHKRKALQAKRQMLLKAQESSGKLSGQLPRAWKDS
jgi:hypothetical protein